MALRKEHLVFGALGALLLLVLGYEALFFKPHMAGQYMAHHSSMHALMAGRTGPSLLGFNILFWVLIFAFVYLLIKGAPKNAEEEDEAVKILKERYAKGEITRDDYLEMFKDLKEG